MHVGRCRMIFKTAVIGAALATGGEALAQSATRAVFVAHYFPVNSVSPEGATIAAFRINDDDTATLVENEPSGEWTQSMALSPNGKWLASANGGGSLLEDLRVYRVEADASLTPVHTRTTPSSPLDMTWINDSLLAVVKTNQGNSEVIVYRWDESTLTLTQADREPTGYFNSSIAAHPTRPWLYTQDSGIFGGLRTIKLFTVSPTGILTFVDFYPSIDPPLDLVISPDGRWLFTGTGAYSTTGAGTVAVFSIDQDTGAVTEVAGSPFFTPGGLGYRSAISSDMRHLYVGHTQTENVLSFDFDQATGSLTPTGHVFNAGPRLSLGPITMLDDLLVVLKDSNDPIGMWIFQTGADGSMTQVGPLYSTGNRRPEYGLVTWSPTTPVCRADFNGSGDVSVQDVFDFLVAYFGGQPSADINGIDGVTVQDIFEFLVFYFAGC